MPVPAPCPQGRTVEGAHAPSPARSPAPGLGGGGRPEGPAAPPASGDGVVTGVRWPRLLGRRPRRAVERALVDGRGYIFRLWATFCATGEVWAGCPPVMRLGGGRVSQRVRAGAPRGLLAAARRPAPVFWVALSCAACRLLWHPGVPGAGGGPRSTGPPLALRHPRVACRGRRGSPSPCGPWSRRPGPVWPRVAGVRPPPAGVACPPAPLPPSPEGASRGVPRSMW